ncbi:MAG: tetratricopeptide repeat protein [Bacteroidia bacterium]|nr:tetratricopeptide repeat protein [Bacteroidia bacterium]
MSQEELARIEAYHAGSLSGKELEEFLALYKSDPAFAEQVELFQTAQDAIEALGQQELKASFRQQYQSNPKKLKPLWKRAYLVAAAVITLLLIFFLFQDKAPSLNPSELYASYEQFDPLSLERGNSDSDSLFLIANGLYNEEQYEAAIPILEGLLEEENFDRKPYARLHLGIAQLKNGNDEAAMDVLQQIGEDSSFYLQAQWKLALAYLKQGNTEQAKEILGMLTTESRTYKNKALELLEAI